MMGSSDPLTMPVEELTPHFDLFEPSHSSRLWEVLDFARTSCPVVKTDADDGYHIVTRYDDLRTVLTDAETYSSAEAGLRGTPIPMPPLTEDPPNHIEFRRALNPYLMRTFLARYEDDIRRHASELLDKLVPRGRFEFMTEFAVPFTTGNLARVILDDDNEVRLQRAIDLATEISSYGRNEAFFELASLAEELLKERMASGSKRDDIVNAILRATVHGRPLTMQEQVGATTILFTGGLDTTKAALGNITRHIADDPSLEARVRDPEWIKDDLDEFLRLDSPIAFMARTVTKETELNGCPLQPGDRVAVHYASANRDPSRFAHPAELDFERERNPHAAFGLGPHRCIGLHFARLQIEIGFQELYKRVTRIRIPEGETVHTATGVVQSHEYLPIEFDTVQADQAVDR
ncbi:cytochrome P450 [Arthrobacter sp. NPDC058127]|uniref:cytochrome P450 n=1 Tax=Arthrobacter sp. NPDC058127 TaxID=3346351 RepID=UPI0036E06AA9